MDPKERTIELQSDDYITLKSILDELQKPTLEQEDEIYKFHKKISSLDESLENIVISI